MLDEMAVFASVVRHGGFTAAAKSLGITKQSVSERVTRLEGRLGVQLLVRTTRALRLTDAGTRYAEACSAIVERADEADRDARESQQHVAGAVRLTAPIGLGAPLLVPAIAELRRSHPAVRVELILDETIVDVVRDGVDLAIRAGSVASAATFVAKPLFESPTVLCASPAFLVEHGRPRTLEELAARPCIARGRGDSWTVGVERVALDPALLINTFEGARDAALGGIGIANLPMPIALADLEAGRLEALFTTSRRIAFTMLWPTRRLPQRVRVVQELLVRRGRALAAAIEATMPR